MSDHSFQVENLSVNVGQRSLLKHINLRIPKGQFVALVGPNGAGKSTLLRAMAGLVKPAHGDITLAGRSLTDMSLSEIAQQLSYLPQRAEIYWNYRVRDILELHTEAGSNPVAKYQSRSLPDSFISEFDIQSLLDRQFKFLSGGEQGRVLLAASLISKPAFLLADEPTAALDVSHQLQLLKRIKDLTSMGLSAVVVMHDLNLASRFAERIVLLNQGQVQLDDTSQNAILSPVLDVHFDIDFQRLTKDSQTTLIAHFKSEKKQINSSVLS